MMIDKSLAVVIVNYGAADFIIKHFDKTVAATQGFRDPQIYIADNASPGDDLEKLNAHIEAVGLANVATAFDTGGNLGFAGGNNAAFARFKSAPDYVFFLNPDAWSERNAIALLAETLEANPKIAVAAPRIINEAGVTAVSYFNFPTVKDQFGSEAELDFLHRRSGWRVLDLENQNAPVDAEWVSGAAFLLRMDAAATPPMDDGYFLYFEETDMMRALRSEGWGVLLNPEAVVTHVGGLATGADASRRDQPMPSHWYRSWRRYFVKQYGVFGALVASLLKVAGIGAYYAKAGVRGFQPRRPKRHLRNFLRYALAPLLIGKRD
jgi:GT2 family glycosyltransferase